MLERTSSPIKPTTNKIDKVVQIILLLFSDSQDSYSLSTASCERSGLKPISLKQGLSVRSFITSPSAFLSTNLPASNALWAWAGWYKQISHSSRAISLVISIFNKFLCIKDNKG